MRLSGTVRRSADNSTPSPLPPGEEQGEGDSGTSHVRRAPSPQPSPPRGRGRGPSLNGFSTVGRIVALVCVLLPAAAQAQDEGLVQIESDLTRFLLRQHVLGTLPAWDAGALPISAWEAQALLDSLAAHPEPLSRTDRALVAGFRGERVGGLLGPAFAARTPFYRDGLSPAAVRGDGYALTLTPLFNVAAGPAYVNRVGQETEWTRATLFSRGLRVAGHAGRVYVETRITENQELRPLGPSRAETAERLGWVRTTGTPDPTYDYMLSTGVVGYRSRLFEARAGRDRQRWGFARGALLVSNYATDYDHVELRWTLGPVTLQSLYARLLDPRSRDLGDGLTSQRYGAFHRVALRPGGGVELEAFEGVFFGDRDGDGRSGFELAYLIPFQLYRAVERDLGSPDNVMLGGGAAWRPTPGVRLYTQALLDELTAARFFEDAWTNKWGIVAGFDLVDPGLPGLGRLRDTELHVEYGRVRPFVYAHFDSLSAAVHYGDVFGFPAGPNASDLNVRIAHRPHPDVQLSADLIYTVRGRNTDSLNYGADPYVPYTTRVPEPNPTLQGIRQRQMFADLRIGVRVLPDVIAGGVLSVATVDDAERGGSGVVTPQVFLRWALAEPSPRY